MDSNRTVVPSFSFLIPFRDREIDRVENCLKCISGQFFRDFEVIFIDYGSEIDTAQKVRKVVESFGFTYLYTDTRNMFWNQNEALNIGLINSKKDYIVRLDVDILIPSNFLNYILEHINHENYINCQCYYTSNDFKFSSFENIDFKNLVVSDYTATGLCMVVYKEHLLKINGFNEFYILWGFDDLDASRKLKSINLEVKWSDYRVLPIVHQWHPKSTLRLSNVVFDTKKKYFLEDRTLKSEQFGIVKKTEDRLCFNLVDTLNHKRKLEIRTYLKSFEVEWFYRFTDLREDEYLYLNHSSLFQENPKSKIGFGVDFLNKIFKKVALSYRLVSIEQFDHPLSIDSIENFIILFVMNFRDQIKDYYFKREDSSIIFIVVKR